MLLFVFYCVPVTMEFYSNISEYWTHRIGQILLFFYFVTLYTHVGIAINRYFAVCRPLQYRKSSSRIFSVLFVLLVWLAGFLHILPLFFGVQSFYFHDDSLLFYYGDDEFSQVMAHYIDFIYGCSIMGIVFLLDCVTLSNLRHLLKSHNQNIGNAKTAERNNIKKEVLFFIQAFLNMACFVVLLIFFHLVYKLVSDSKWGSFFTTTFAWVTMHAVDGIVLASFSYIYSKKKGIACLGSKVASTTSNLIVPKIKVSKVR